MWRRIPSIPDAPELDRPDRDTLREAINREPPCRRRAGMPNAKRYASPAIFILDVDGELTTTVGDFLKFGH
jgi:hypothetical protein